MGTLISSHLINWKIVHESHSTGSTFWSKFMPLTVATRLFKAVYAQISHKDVARLVSMLFVICEGASAHKIKFLTIRILQEWFFMLLIICKGTSVHYINPLTTKVSGFQSGHFG